MIVTIFGFALALERGRLWDIGWLFDRNTLVLSAYRMGSQSFRFSNNVLCFLRHYDVPNTSTEEKISK